MVVVLLLLVVLAARLAFLLLLARGTLPFSAVTVQRNVRIDNGHKLLRDEERTLPIGNRVASVPPIIRVLEDRGKMESAWPTR